MLIRSFIRFRRLISTSSITDLDKLNHRTPLFVLLGGIAVPWRL